MKQFSDYRTALSGAAIVLTVVAASTYIASRRQPKLPATSNLFPIGRERSVEAGGVRRPQADIGYTSEYDQADAASLARRMASTDRTKTKQVSRLAEPGSIAVSRQTNSAAAAAIEAYETGTHPERLTPTELPAPFNKERFIAAPSAYVGVAEPGRVWQTAQPGDGVQPLRPKGSTLAMLRQHESVRLQVKANPGFPVSFTAFDGGVFDNSLPAMTVVADQQGVATVVFTAGAGVTNDVHVLAGSPMHSGQVGFVVHVHETAAGTPAPRPTIPINQ